MGPHSTSPRGPFIKEPFRRGKQRGWRWPLRARVTWWHRDRPPAAAHLPKRLLGPLELSTKVLWQGAHCAAWRGSRRDQSTLSRGGLGQIQEGRRGESGAAFPSLLWQNKGNISKHFYKGQLPFAGVPPERVQCSAVQELLFAVIMAVIIIISLMTLYLYIISLKNVQKC